MTLGTLLTIIGVMLAIYALARPPQRRSIILFVPFWPVMAGLIISSILLISLDVLVQWGVRAPGWKFGLGTTAFLLPIVVTSWAVLSWRRAKLAKNCESKFGEFLLSCMRDGEYDEAVRILTQNTNQLAQILTEDTADLVFDQQFVRALVSARSWLHLALLTDEALLKKLPDSQRAVDRTIRELLTADYSPLRTSALLDEGGDETIGCTDEEMALIDRTLRERKGDITDFPVREPEMPPSPCRVGQSSSAGTRSTLSSPSCRSSRSTRYGQSRWRNRVRAIRRACSEARTPGRVGTTTMSSTLVRDSYLAPTPAGIPSGDRGKGFPQVCVRERILARARECVRERILARAM